VDTPTAASIREDSRVDFAPLGYPEGTPDPLDDLVAIGIGFFYQFTGRMPDSTWPAELPESAADYVVRRIVEILAFQAQNEYVETLGDFQLLSSFSAGSYSESRRSLTELKEARMLVGDPALDAVLWSLMTDEKQEEWQEWVKGEPGPAWGVTEVEWAAGYVTYDPTLGPDGLSAFPDRPRSDGL
jgi:hypothetical protein